MEPELYINDIVAVKGCSVEELKQNDIITFENEGEIISHRIVRIINSGDEIRFVTKGDNNDIVDNFDIENETIYGKVIFKIPKIGGFVSVIQENGILKTISLVLIGFIIFKLKDDKKSDRKMKRKKYEIKSIRDNYNEELQKERLKVNDGDGRKS